MINAIHNRLHIPAAVTPPTATTQAARSNSSSSTSFSSELAGQNSLPNSLSLFASPSPATATAAAATAATTTPTPTVQPNASTSVPTAQSVFGSQPWMQDPQGTGPNNTSWNYNPIYFATPATAQQVASMVGGTVIQQECMTPAAGSPLQQSQMNEMVQMPNGTVVNPGLIADFYDHGYSQSFVDQMIQNEIKGV